MKIKHMIGGVLIKAGMLASFEAVGHLDFLDARSRRYGSAEVKETIVKSAARFSRQLPTICATNFLTSLISVYLSV